MANKQQYLHDWCLFDRVIGTKKHYIRFLEWTINLDRSSWEAPITRAFIYHIKVFHAQDIDWGHVSQLFNDYVIDLKATKFFKGTR